MTELADRLLIEIARCPVVETCVKGDGGEHPCSTVVLHQWPDVHVRERRSRWRAEHHVPEPWVGHLELAPLLFLSSNPSLSSVRPPHAPTPTAPIPFPNADVVQRDHPAVGRGLQAPKPSWSDEELIDRYTAAFDVWMADGVRQIADSSGALSSPVPFWRDVKRLAEALWARPVVPGYDYALTEIVHCKSTNETGVANAAEECVSRYLRRVLALSPAAVIVVLGSLARNAFRAEFGYPDAGVVSAPIEIEERTRRIVFLAHPAARSRSRYPKRPSEDDVAELADWLRAAARARKFTWEAGDITDIKRPPGLQR